MDEFVNADVIARDQGLSDVAAGRRTLAKLEALAAARRDIAFETTLASRMLLPRIQAMQAAGYGFHLTFFWLPSADMAVERVANRVASGGHSIPEDVIRRRYERGLDNFFNAYLPVADSWLMVNNTFGINRAVTAALRRHKERGESVVIWRDGKIVTLGPDEIEV